MSQKNACFPQEYKSSPKASKKKNGKGSRVPVVLPSSNPQVPLTFFFSKLSTVGKSQNTSTIASTGHASWQNPQ